MSDSKSNTAVVEPLRDGFIALTASQLVLLGGNALLEIPAPPLIKIPLVGLSGCADIAAAILITIAALNIRALVNKKDVAAK